MRPCLIAFALLFCACAAREDNFEVAAMELVNIHQAQNIPFGSNKIFIRNYQKRLRIDVAPADVKEDLDALARAGEGKADWVFKNRFTVFSKNFSDGKQDVYVPGVWEDRILGELEARKKAARETGR